MAPRSRERSPERRVYEEVMRIYQQLQGPGRLDGALLLEQGQYLQGACWGLGQPHVEA